MKFFRQFAFSLFSFLVLLSLFLTNFSFATVVKADSLPPVVSATSLHVDTSGCTGSGGTVCIIGDTVQFTWDNSATGDGADNTGHPAVASVSADLSNFGGREHALLSGAIGCLLFGDRLHCLPCP